MSGTHSKLSPSKSAIWAFCYGALAYAERSGVKPSPSNIHSASGTLSHQIAESWLSNEEAPTDLIGTKVTVDGFEFTVDDERMERIGKYVYAIAARAGVKHYEVKLNLDPVLLTEGESGTADAAIVDLDNMRLEAHDLKDGQGAVDVIDNDQLILYMLALMFQMEADYFCEFQEFECFIHQPKVYAEPQSVKYTREEMLGHLKRLRYAASRNMDLLHKDATLPKIISALNPSYKACKWCPMAGPCVARSKQVADQFPDVSVQPSQLTPDQISGYLKAAIEIEAWFSRLRGDALALAKQGTTIPGFKLANGREGPRQWIDAEAAEEALYEVLEAKTYSKEVISPTNAQKKIAKPHPKLWAALQANIKRSEGEVTLVPESDARAPVSLEVPEFSDATGADLIG